VVWVGVYNWFVMEKASALQPDRVGGIVLACSLGLIILDRILTREIDEWHDARAFPSGN